jgi:hypothetical protein
MKPVMLSIVLFTAMLTQAQSDRYDATMKKNLALFDSAKTTQDFDNLSNVFARIGDAEKTQWLPYYYAALAEVRIGWMDQKSDKDQLAEKVNDLVSKAEAIENNAELCTIRNMTATQQMLVDPQTRWQTYGMDAANALKKGMQLDPNNPRLYYLQGMSLFNTPEQYGGGKDRAKPVFQKAVDLFKTAQVKPLYPNWGLKESEDMIVKCQ